MTPYVVVTRYQKPNGPLIVHAYAAATKGAAQYRKARFLADSEVPAGTLLEVRVCKVLDL